MNTFFTIFAWIVILSIVPVMIWGTVGDGSIAFIIDVIKEDMRHGKA